MTTGARNAGITAVMDARLAVADALAEGVLRILPSGRRIDRSAQFLAIRCGGGFADAQGGQSRRKPADQSSTQYIAPGHAVGGALCEIIEPIRHCILL